MRSHSGSQVLWRQPQSSNARSTLIHGRRRDISQSVGRRGPRAHLATERHRVLQCRQHGAASAAQDEAHAVEVRGYQRPAVRPPASWRAPR